MSMINITLEDIREFYNRLLPEEIKKQMTGRNGISQRDMLYQILPGTTSKGGNFVEVLIRQHKDKRKDKSPSGATISRFFKGQSSAYIEMGKLIEKNLPGTSAPVYSECLARKTMVKNWQALLKKTGDFPQGKLEDGIRSLIEIIPKAISGSPKERLLKLLESQNPNKIAEILASLTMICITLYYWNMNYDLEAEEPGEKWADKLKEDRKTFENIKRLILPPDSENVFSAYNVDWDMNQNAGAQLKEAKVFYDKIVEARAGTDISKLDREIKKCCERCFRILGYDEFSPVKYDQNKISREIQGEAAYIIYLLSSASLFQLRGGESPVQYLEYSFNCVNDAIDEKWAKDVKEEWAKEVKKRWNEEQPFSLQYKREHASDDSTGIYVFNAMNTLADIVSDTAPIQWKAVTRLTYWWDENVLENLGISEQISLKPGQPQKYMLFDDNQQRNLQNALAVLQYIKNYNKAGYASKKDWQVEIYLRAKEEQISPVIDTAQSHMDGCVIPVYIIDEDKKTAQQLLYYHPLIYTIKDISSQTQVRFNLIILGDNDYAEWMLRQAYWLLCFQENTIETRIVVLGLKAEALEKKLQYTCKEMFRSGTCETKNIETYNINIPELLAGISRGGEERYYFAIDIGSDEENLVQAIHLREDLIRDVVRSESFLGSGEMREMPVIAFRCRSSDIAIMSKTMAVQMEAFGNKWFNNYSLIPFGMLDDLYSWRRLDGDLLENMAKCIHLQYCGVEPIHDGDNAVCDLEYKDQIDMALSSYYQRQYNRDSSLAVAISLPYRLFQCQYKMNRIVPSVIWDIHAHETFENQSVLEDLAMRFETFGGNSDNIKKLAKWEHMRWVRYMESLGWQAASTDEAVAYYNAGNPRQQLYIARMHPCMCEYQKLEELEDILNEEERKRGEEQKHKIFDFRKNDEENVRKTAEILRRSWFR